MTWQRRVTHKFCCATPRILRGGRTAHRGAIQRAVKGTMRLSGLGLRCVRGGREVFSGLDFAASSGEALAVVGANGAGKTSLLRLIAGRLHLSDGSLVLEGGEAELTLPEQAHYLGHRDALKPALSVIENLAFWRDFLARAAGARAV